MDGTAIYTIRDLGPLLVSSAFGLAGLMAGWLVTRHRNRIDRLREAWASWTAWAFEAVEKHSDVIECETDIRQSLEEREQVKGPILERALAPVIADALVPVRKISAEAIWRLRRDHHLLEILEDDGDALKAADSVTALLVNQNSNPKVLNDIRIKIRHLSLDNRLRFLHPLTRRWRVWRGHGLE